jgi:hypothetical protein
MANFIFPEIYPKAETCKVNWIRVWLGPTAGMDVVAKREITLSSSIQHFYHPFHGHSLY